jgi:hypothetical protein
MEFYFVFKMVLPKAYVFQISNWPFFHVILFQDFQIASTIVVNTWTSFDGGFDLSLGRFVNE